MVVLKWTTSIQLLPIYCRAMMMMMFILLLPIVARQVSGIEGWPRSISSQVQRLVEFLPDFASIGQKCSQSAIALSTRCNYAPTIFISIFSSYLLPHHLNRY